MGSGLWLTFYLWMNTDHDPELVINARFRVHGNDKSGCGNDLNPTLLLYLVQMLVATSFPAVEDHVLGYDVNCGED